ITVRHATFFEMLGNFSFGDYFKKQAIEWAWEFTTQVLKMPADRLWPSVYREDDEAFDLWAKHIGLGAKRVTKLGDKDNFWGPAGGAGACGPCSEIYWDQGPGTGCGRPECAPGCDCERYLEFWNLVFPQFDQAPTGERKPLANRGIDTGMGLERLAMILQTKASVFDIDLLAPIGDAVRAMGSPREAATDRGRHAAKVITDHMRALVFTFAEGVRPSNEGRGYVVRRLLRRAARLGKNAGIHGTFLSRLVPVVVRQMSAHDEYAYLKKEESVVAAAVLEEESRFAETLEQGVARFEEAAAALAKGKDAVLPGSVAFQLYDTFGFPIDLTIEMAGERGLKVDVPAYEAAMEEQRERARKSGRFETRRTNAGPWQTVSTGSHSEFVGYENLKLDGVAIRSWRERAGDGPREVELTLDRTPFYPEGGGQVGDVGWITSAAGGAGTAGSAAGGPAGAAGTGGTRLRVLDTYREGDAILHRAEVVAGTPGAGPYTAEVDAVTRAATQRNHTATHLLHAALRRNLGTHLKQAGSLVAPDRLRFDFSHGKPLTSDEVHAIEREVNEKILADLPVRTEITSLKEAQAQGAMALFGEKYGDRVRQVSVGEYSRELCGGCHVGRTGEIGYLRVESEAAVAAGVRRIEAATGALAYQHAEDDRALLRQIAAKLGVPKDQAAARVAALTSETKKLHEQQQKQSQGNLRAQVAELIQKAKAADPPLVIAVVDAGSVEELRGAGDLVREGLPGGGGLLAAVIDGKLSIAAAVGKGAVERLAADAWVRDAVSIVGGRGGGKKEMAVAGAKDAAGLKEVLARGLAFAEERLKGSAEASR
ncbi:MAG: alanine--tRNA ligase, partial [Candidatus Eiseniibacteriota bacterium]